MSGRADSSQSLEGRTAIVTGASAGIGRATALALGRAGANVAVTARSEDQLEALAAEIRERHGRAVSVLPADVREEAEVEAVVEETVERFGSLDVLVNNAGTALSEPVDVADMSTEDYRRLMEVNVDGSFFATRAALPHLRESGGNLVFVGSEAALAPRATYPVYAATKYWIRGFAHSVEARAGPDGVAVTVVNPSEVRTEMEAHGGETMRETYEEGEELEPSEVADAIVFATTQSEWATVSELDLYSRDNLTDYHS